MRPDKEKAKEIRRQKLENFNSNVNGLSHHGLFGLPFSEEESEIVIVPVPWEATVSYGEGTAHGPEAVLKASHQIDLYDPLYPDGWKLGIAMQPVSPEVVAKNANRRAQTSLYLHEFATGEEMSPNAMQILAETNKGTEELAKWVAKRTRELLEQDKIVGVLGGEHSVPLGFMRALAEKYDNYGILQIDAHADLRIAYEGFTHSHASIMYNAIQIPQVSKLVQVGIRDFCQEEADVAKNSNGKVDMLTDYELRKAQYEGKLWKDVCDDIISRLPQNVYISFDIDGLQPWLCPNTGTPVAGGFLLEETVYLLERLVNSGRKIIGFDLCEVSPGDDEWDGNVGSRVLYKLCLLAAKSLRQF
jgi:agmatinase